MTKPFFERLFRGVTKEDRRLLIGLAFTAAIVVVTLAQSVA